MKRIDNDLLPFDFLLIFLTKILGFDLKLVKIEFSNCGFFKHG